MLKLFTLFTAALQESNDLLSEEQQSQLKQLQESKNVDTEVLIPVSLLLCSLRFLSGEFYHKS